MYKSVLGAVLVALAVVACNGAFQDEMKVFNKNLQTCLDKFNMKDDMNTFLKNHMKEPTRDSWTVMACVAKKDGSLGGDNKYDIKQMEENSKQMKDKYPDIYNKMMPALTKCAETTNADNRNAEDELKAVEVFSMCMRASGAVPPM